MPGETTKGPTLDLNADSISGVLDGDSLETWSGDNGGATFVQATAGSRPKYWAGLGPIAGAAVYFDGANDNMKSSSIMSSIVGASEFHVFVVAAVAEATAGGGANPFENETLLSQSAVDKWAVTFRAGNPDAGVCLHDGATQDAIFKYTGLENAWALYEFSHNGAEILCRINGQPGSPTSAGSCSDLTGTIYLGTDSGTAYFFKGYLARLVVYNAALSEDEAQLVRESLNTLYGLYA
ncbi:MAG: hypothetical protein IPK72_21105 [Candidatus Eisenbacteria bacterium]|nr:hypothetical protein [Candidatus Eisenbacteria bacterium]